MRASGLLDHPFRDAYAARAGVLPGATQPWVDGLRQTARGLLNAAGLPGPKAETWKFTPLADVARIPFVPACAVAAPAVRELPPGVPSIAGARCIVLVNGVPRPELSERCDDLKGLRVASFRDVLAREPQTLKPYLGGLASAGALPLAALNTAYMADGLVVIAEPGFAGATLHVVSLGAAGAEPAAFHPRHVVVLNPGARLTMVESHVGLPGQSYLANPVAEIGVGEGARLDRYVMVAEDPGAFHFATAVMAVAAGGRVESFHLGLGGAKVRQEVRAALNGPEAACRINGVYALGGTAHHDLTTVVEHLVPRGTSSQLVKGVVDDRSHAVFQGRIHVAPNAQKTDARQLHKALFLGRGPAVDCKPELEIFADDVQCAHGAATGELNPDHLFYLMARGIDRETAYALLVTGFLDEAVETIADDGVRAAFAAAVHAWLKRRAA
jgi:Fe-S cluster assembly protein SufD